METQRNIPMQAMALLYNLYLMRLLTYLMIQLPQQTVLLDLLGVREHRMEAQQFLISIFIMIRDQDQEILYCWLKV